MITSVYKEKNHFSQTRAYNVNNVIRVKKVGAVFLQATLYLFLNITLLMNV